MQSVTSQDCHSMKWVFVAKLGLAVCLLAWIIFSVDVRSLLSLMIAIPWYLFLLGAGVVLLQAVILALRWNELTAFFTNSELSLTASITAILISFFFSQGLPASFGGDAVRVWLLKERSVSVKEAVKAVLVDRFWGFSSLLVLACGGLAYLVAIHQIVDWLLPLGVAAGAFFAIALALTPLPRSLFHTLSQTVESIFPPLSRIIGSFARLKENFDQFNSDPRRFGKTLLQSVLVHALTVVIACLPFLLQPNKVSLIAFSAAIPPALLVAYLPISIAGWGVREGGLVASLSLVGVSVEQALAISLFLGLTVLIVSLAGGVLWLVSDARRYFSRNPSTEMDST
jgi:glycosyltransferase 2 family protein